MKTTAYVSHSDCSRHDTGWGHPEHQGRLPAVARAVYRDMLTLFEPLLELEAVPAREGDLLLGHSSRYVQQVRAAAAQAAAQGTTVALDGDTRVSGASWEAAVAAVGAAITAVEAVLDGRVRNAFCATRPPGHAAGRDGAGRFALFNPVAVAARHLRERRDCRRVLVVEWGDAWGAGTAEILAGDAGARFVSVHRTGPRPPAAHWPPWVSQLPEGADGDVVIAALASALDRSLEDFEPDFILLSLGCDALATDPLGELSLTALDFYRLTEAVRARADTHCAGRLVSVLEEGYDPLGMGDAVVQHLRALAALAPA